MKYHLIKVALLSVTVVLIGCKDDTFQNEMRPANTGDEIIFGATGEIETEGGPESRTSYGDIKNGKQDINWSAGDRIMIYSPQVKNVTTPVDYEVKNIVDNAGTLAKFEMDKPGLQWGPDDMHTFYAVYPAKSSLDEDYQKNFDFQGSKLIGYIPTTQAHTWHKSTTTGEWISTPNMKYAHMVAKKTMSKTNGGNGVDLDFYPIVSAMDITLTATKTVRLNSVNIRAEDGEAIAGKYVADLSTITEQKPAPDCDLTNSPELNLNFITIPLYTDPGTGIPVPMEIEAGHSIKLTVFLLPHVNLDNLSVSVSHVNAAAKKKDLVGITLEPHKKVIVTMQLPEWSSSDNVNTWFSNLNPNVYISQLSIPGTVNAFSYLLKDGDLNKSQTADIEKQWNAGVRCFELRSPNNVKGGSLAGAPLQCNRNDLGITFGDAFTQIINLLEKNPTEFVMIMPSFETSAGHSGTDNERKVSNSEDYLRDLNEFYNSFNMPSTLHFVTYNEKMVVGDLRGGVMSIARITSEEDDQSLVELLRGIGIAKGQAITGWGSLKDNWGNRGYLRNGTRVSNYAKDYNDGKNMEYCMLNGNTTQTTTGWLDPDTPEHLSKTDVPVGYSNDIVLPDKTDLENFRSVVDYSHDSFRSDKSIGKVFVHEWLRVVPSKAAGNYYLHSTSVPTGWNETLHTYYWAYWKESYSEKQNDVWNTFLMSQEANKGQLGYAFFINSLEGYYVDPNINLSYWPYIDQNKPYSGDFGQGGVEGDITTYAQDINTWFYEKLLDVGMNNITGPLNIVLLNRVLDGSAGGDYLPQVIVDNNFKFPLMMK